MDIYEPEFVKRLFNQMSSSYERMNFITSFGFSIIWRKQFINKLSSSNSDIKVIDLLSGLGENWNYLIKKYPNAEFTALDFSDEMVKKSKSKSSKKFNVLQEDVLQNNLPAQEFDILTCAFGLKTFNDEQLDILAKTISHILKKGGEFGFIEISTPKHRLLLSLYRLYLGRIIPILGKLFLGNPNDYRMLWTYTENFGDSEKVKRIFENNNLNVKFDSYFFGCATGISGSKM
jgi:demethylmenaquinone methyltransferase/2-methoxy-6-polyprenyl-1,4-benzoquinol methylase